MVDSLRGNPARELVSRDGIEPEKRGRRPKLERLRTAWLKQLSQCARAGEPGRNRTVNPQIKSLLLCQLSYRPTSVFLSRGETLILSQG